MVSRNALRLVLAVWWLYVLPAFAQSTAHEPFPPLEAWKTAVRSGDAATIRKLYSVNPAPSIETPKSEVSGDADAAFWAGLKARSIDVTIVQSATPQSGVRQLVLQTEVHPGAPARAQFINVAQVWQQQGSEWRLVMAKRTDPARLLQPVELSNEIYLAGVNPRTEVKEALERASKGHKRVLVVFGANWCFDCHVLDAAFHRSDIAPLLARDYEVIHVDVGRGEKNQDLMNEYQVPMKRGIPAIAVLDSDGKLLFSQKEGQFENARSLGPEDLLQFLNKWKPEAR